MNGTSSARTRKNALTGKTISKGAAVAKATRYLKAKTLQKTVAETLWLATNAVCICSARVDFAKAIRVRSRKASAISAVVDTNARVTHAPRGECTTIGVASTTLIRGAGCRA